MEFNSSFSTAVRISRFWARSGSSCHSCSISFAWSSFLISMLFCISELLYNYGTIYGEAMNIFDTIMSGRLPVNTVFHGYKEG